MFIKLTEFHSKKPVLLNTDNVVYFFKRNDGCQVYSASVQRDPLVVCETLAEIAAILVSAHNVDSAVFKGE